MRAKSKKRIRVILSAFCDTNLVNRNNLCIHTRESEKSNCVDYKMRREFEPVRNTPSVIKLLIPATVCIRKAKLCENFASPKTTTTTTTTIQHQALEFWTALLYLRIPYSLHSGALYVLLLLLIIRELRIVESMWTILNGVFFSPDNGIKLVSMFLFFLFFFFDKGNRMPKMEIKLFRPLLIVLY